jgi:hypothetical protein
MVGHGWIEKSKEAKVMIRSCNLNGECGREGGYHAEGKLTMYESNCIFLFPSHTKLFITILRQLEIVDGSICTSLYSKHV